MFKLTEDEQVYARQLFDIRKKIAQLRIEEDTHVDRLLSILRGHQVKRAEGGGYLVSSIIMDSKEEILVTHHGLYAHNL